jgi:hypothetical protein
MAKAAALGFRLHTGWAVLVALAGVPGKFEVLFRRRIELLPAGDSIPRFIYHQAAELAPARAAELVQRGEDASRETAHVAVKEALKHLRSLGLEVKAAGIPSGSRPVPKELSAVLRSHPLIHTAEGELFRRAITSACKSCSLPVIFAREREVWPNVASAWGLKEAGLRKQVEGLRASVGAPWGSDQKTAAAFALLALR